MKKQFTALMAGAVAAALLFSAAGCGGGEKPDREAPAFDDAQATLKLTGVDTGANGDVSDELYGVFLEDINYASQALDDNMVKNGSFEKVAGAKYSDGKHGWTASGATLTVLTDANGVMGESYKDYNSSYHLSYASVEATANGTLVNSGYTPAPMAVTEGTDYVFSAFMKSSAAVNVTVTVTDGTADYASVTIPVSGGWKKYKRTVTATGTMAEGLKLQLKFSAAATVCLDAVSFETTDSTVGIKNYLYNAVKELGPKFIRFPGGCIIEGENYNQAYDWKNSIGAVSNGANAGDDTVPALNYTLNTESGDEAVTTYGEYVTREANVNLWENNGGEYFLMDYGIGFYDYFLLCDSLGASALPVVNCGLSCQGQAYPGAALQGRHNKKIADYIRDAADLIEFAKGDKTTTWGAVRAAMGHEEPFKMNYIGVGNEQWNAGGNSDYFTGYYEKFLEDEYFMEKCEQYGVQLIVGNHQELRNCEGYDSSIADNPWNQGTDATGGDARKAALAYMNKGKISSLGEYGVQDHHYYNSPVDFFLHTHLYDNYTREGANRYEVFVGEYSANNNLKYSGDFSSIYKINNWFSALAEAAAMTGFERNGDIVKLAAYAPIFAPVNESQRHWAVDMMLFTNTELVRTANYYVQQLFMQNAGTKKLTSELNFASGTETTFEPETAGKTRKLDRLYYVASVDETTGDYIVKIVNADEFSAIRLNIDLGDANITGIAAVTELSAAYQDVNSLEDTPVAPVNYTVGGFTKSVAGIRLAPSSVTAIRFHIG